MAVFWPLLVVEDQKTCGRVLLAGEDLLEKSPAEMRRVRGKQIAMVLQDPMTSLNPALPIGTQVSEVVRLRPR